MHLPSALVQCFWVVFIGACAFIGGTDAENPHDAHVQTGRHIRHRISATLRRSDSDVLPPPSFTAFLAKLGCYLACPPGTPCDQPTVRCLLHNDTDGKGTSSKGPSESDIKTKPVEDGEGYVNYLLKMHRQAGLLGRVRSTLMPAPSQPKPSHHEAERLAAINAIAIARGDDSDMDDEDLLQNPSYDAELVLSQTSSSSGHSVWIVAATAFLVAVMVLIAWEMCRMSDNKRGRVRTNSLESGFQNSDIYKNYTSLA